MRIALVNPNTSTATTEMMCRIARAAVPGAQIDGFTAPFGAPLITDAAALAEAALAVETLEPALRSFDAVVIAAFADPGLDVLRPRLRGPVTGLAEAAMREAGRGGRPFAVATTTPDLRAAIASRAAAESAHGFLGTWVTPGDAAGTMAEPARLVAALETACRDAIDAGAEAIIIGGGPLAKAAEILADRLPVPLVAPIPAAMSLTLSRLGRAP